MDPDHATPIRAAEVVLPCGDLNETLAFFTGRLGFRVDAIMPADRPEVAVISGHGVRLRLQSSEADAPGVLRLSCVDVAAVGGGEVVLTAPNGTRVELAEADPPAVVPPGEPSFVLTRAADETRWETGRAGMRYRDLIPGRQGGRFAASLIHIPDGGEVADWVHFHVVRFQVLYCRRGWVRVVYEDQGPPLVMNAGDCVLQPPRIRHRVLECSPGLEVIEISCPAHHETSADHELALPTPDVRPDREFEGQRFVHDVAAGASWGASRLAGFECRETGVASASGGLVGLRVHRAREAGAPETHGVDAEFTFVFVLRGTATLHVEGQRPTPLAAGDCVVLPAGTGHGVAECSEDLELLEVVSPVSAA